MLRQHHWGLIQGKSTSNLNVLRRQPVLASIVLTHILAWPLVPAFAADATSGAQEEVIEEIVVTSRRRDESVQDVPLSVTAFGAEQIEQLRPESLRDFDGLAPNLYVGTNAAGPGASAIYIRGVGYADIEKTQAPQVGVIVDGVQLGSSTGQLIDAFDIESIEVNRGPQGVLFGRNTIGGNIVVNRVRPEFEDFGFKVSSRAGNFSSHDVRARANIPLGDRVALKIGATDRRSDGFYDNDTLNETAGDVDFSAQVIALRAKPTDALDLTLTYDRVRDNTDTKPQDPRFDGDDPFQTLSEKRQPTSYDVDQVGLRLQWDAGPVTINSITAYHDSADLVDQDFDGAATLGPTSGVSVPFAQLHTLRDQEFDVFSQELRISGDFYNDQFSYQAGLYYLEHEIDFRQTTNNILQLPDFALGLPAGVPCAAAGLRSNDLAPTICQLPNARSTQIASEELQSFAAFAALFYRPTDRAEISFGLRYIDEEKDATNSYFDFSDGTFDPPGTDGEFDFTGRPQTAGVAYEASDSWDDVIITASASYAFTDDILTYVNYSEGFRSGGFSIRSARDPSEAPFDPEDAFQIEAGFKGSFFDRRVTVNGAYFFLERDGTQFSSIIPLPPGSIPGTTTLINNGGTSTTQGVELELSFLVNQNFSFSVNGGFIDVDNRAFTIACDNVDACVTPVPGVLDPSGTLRMLGDDSDSRQPEWNYSVNAFYDREIGPGVLSLNVNWKHQGESLLVNTGGGADQDLFERDYGQLGARISYQVTRENGDIFTLSADGRNLTDTVWLENALFLGGPTTGFQSFGPPRVYGFELSYSH